MKKIFLCVETTSLPQLLVLHSGFRTRIKSEIFSLFSAPLRVRSFPNLDNVVQMKEGRLFTVTGQKFLQASSQCHWRSTSQCLQTTCL